MRTRPAGCYLGELPRAAPTRLASATRPWPLVTAVAGWAKGGSCALSQRRTMPIFTAETATANSRGNGAIPWQIGRPALGRLFGSVRCRDQVSRDDRRSSSCDAACGSYWALHASGIRADFRARSRSDAIPHASAARRAARRFRCVIAKRCPRPRRAAPSAHRATPETCTQTSFKRTNQFTCAVPRGTIRSSSMTSTTSGWRAKMDIRQLG